MRAEQLGCSRSLPCSNCRSFASFDIRTRARTLTHAHGRSILVRSHPLSPALLRYARCNRYFTYCNRDIPLRGVTFAALRPAVLNGVGVSASALAACKSTKVVQSIPFPKLGPLGVPSSANLLAAAVRAKGRSADDGARPIQSWDSGCETRLSGTWLSGTWLNGKRLSGTATKWDSGQVGQRPSGTAAKWDSGQG